MAKITEIPAAFIRGDVVYMLYEIDEIIYIGKSRTALQRLITHDREKAFDGVRVATPQMGHTVDELEQALIR